MFTLCSAHGICRLLRPRCIEFVLIKIKFHYFSYKLQHFQAQTMFRNVRYIASSLSESNVTRVNRFNRRILNLNRFTTNLQIRSKKTNPSVSTLFRPLDVRPSNDEDQNVGAEITGAKIDKNEMSRILNKFVQMAEVRMLCLENGLDGERRLIEYLITIYCDFSYSTATSVCVVPSLLSRFRATSS